MKFTRNSDEGFGSGWRFEWGWLPDRLDALRGPLALANHVGRSAISHIRRSLRKQNPRVTITLDVFSPDDRRAVVLTISGRMRDGL